MANATYGRRQQPSVSALDWPRVSLGIKENLLISPTSGKDAAEGLGGAMGRKLQPTQSDQNFGMGLAFIILLPVFGWLGFKCLEYDFLRIFGWVLLSFAFGVPALMVLIIARSIISSSTSNAPLAKSSTANTEALEHLELVNTARKKIIAVVDGHLETLARRRLALVSVDHYGIVKAEGWKKEVQYFVDGVVRPTLTSEEANAIAPRMNAIFQELVEDRVALRMDEIEAEFAFEGVDGPVAFERWCAKALERNGWTATVTKASGDQGADVLARKGRSSIILQCKLYSSPVGNKAVQEAFAAQRHYGTSKSAVVTNADFTKSARELAASTKVLLLHHSELSRLDDFVEGAAAAL
jgi:restriction system protein